jgi:hypothetical protein
MGSGSRDGEVSIPLCDGPATDYWRKGSHFVCLCTVYTKIDTERLQILLGRSDQCERFSSVSRRGKLSVVVPVSVGALPVRDQGDSYASSRYAMGQIKKKIFYNTFSSNFMAINLQESMDLVLNMIGNELLLYCLQ